jgi:phosphoribosylaminoimidazolecarboxamide formyltransferase/IMP cyclohydrolase
VPAIHRALISVSDKRGLIEFARALSDMGVELISTGGTHAALSAHNIPARTVSDITGFPEILDGRVKTLHPAVHAGLLAVDDNANHSRQISQLGIRSIDMVVVNLYPFEETVAREGVTLEEAVEQIDIGGPAMVRSAAKNFRFRAVVTDPGQYQPLVEELRTTGGLVSAETCQKLSRAAFRHTASYDAAVAAYLDSAADGATDLPETLLLSAKRELTLRYGENPHQRAALYGSFGRSFEKLHGKELSYNNILDITAAASLIAEFDEPAAAIVKHMNPCGVGTGQNPAEAYERALATDPASPFGGIIALNRPPDASLAERVNRMFTEVLIAPSFPSGLLPLLTTKKDRRLVRFTGDPRGLPPWEVRTVPGGYLVQERDTATPADESFRVVTRRRPTEAEHRALRFAWRVVRHVKSNAIVYSGEDRTLGIGAGQMSRVDASRLAVRKAAEAGLDLRGSVIASDAFFPFADGLLEAAGAGATAAIQPGGSVRDEEVIRAADEHGVAMVFTGIRHFRH